MQYNANTNTTQIHHHQRPVQIRQKHGESSRNKDFIEIPLLVVWPTLVWETVGKTEESLVIRARHLDKVLDVTIRHCHQGRRRCHHQRTRYSQNSRQRALSLISPRSGVSPILLMTTRWPIRTSRVILAGLIFGILEVFVKLSFVNRRSAFDAWFFLRSFLRMWRESNGMRGAQFENGGAFRDGRDL